MATVLFIMLLAMGSVFAGYLDRWEIANYCLLWVIVLVLSRRDGK